MQKPNPEIMRAAVTVAEQNKTPFGAALAMGDQVFVSAANQTKKLHDPTAHAEVMALRKLGEHLKRTDFSGFTLYTTCEPCPMCMSAAIWAKIDTLFFGCDIETIARFMDQIDLKSSELNDYSFRKVEIGRPVLRDECLELLRKYS